MPVALVGWAVLLGSTAVRGELDAIGLDFVPAPVAGIVEPELSDALRLVREGKPDQARPKVLAYLSRRPNSAPARELNGVILVLAGQVDEGLAEFEKAVAADPGQATAYTKIGDVHLSRGEVELARGKFQRTLALSPSDRLAHQRLGLIAEDDGDIAQAIYHFEQGVAGTGPGYVGIKTNLAGLYNRIGQFGRAVALLAPALKDGAPNPAAHIVLGTAFLGLGEPEAALESFTRAERASGNPDELRLPMGVAYRYAGELEKSESELERALAAAPDNAAVHVQLAETYLSRGRVVDAVDSLERAAEDEGARAVALNRLAEVYWSQDQAELAIQTYGLLKEKGAANLATFVGLSKLYQSLERWGEAEAELRAAAAAYPELAEPRYWLGMHLALTREYDRAEPELLAAQELAPSDPRVRKALSLVALRRGDLDLAIERAEHLLELVPDRAADQFYFATLLEEAGRDGPAVAAYRAALEVDPNHAASLNNLALLELEAGRGEAALELAAKAAELAPEDPVALDTHGWVLYKTKGADEAIPVLTKVLASGKASPTHRYHLAVAYADAGLKDQALLQVVGALALETWFPEREEAERLRRELDPPGAR